MNELYVFTQSNGLLLILMLGIRPKSFSYNFLTPQKMERISEDRVIALLNYFIFSIILWGKADRFNQLLVNGKEVLQPRYR